ncbi:MAG TPA: LysR family transcriptional regulator [Methylomirabilota bacterium]|nr:LysR family transcriptional regulator [Methylomirabilota bacterium]
MPSRRMNLQYAFRLYLNADGQRILGKGGAQILESIAECGSISEAAEELDMSYKFVWAYLTRMRRRLRRPLVVTHRGGTRNGNNKGGGGTVLTPTAKALLKEFKETERLVQNIVSKRRITTVPPL